MDSVSARKTLLMIISKAEFWHRSSWIDVNKMWPKRQSSAMLGLLKTERKGAATFKKVLKLLYCYTII